MKRKKVKITKVDTINKFHDWILEEINQAYRQRRLRDRKVDTIFSRLLF